MAASASAIEIHRPHVPGPIGGFVPCRTGSYGRSGADHQSKDDARSHQRYATDLAVRRHSVPFSNNERMRHPNAACVISGNRSRELSRAPRRQSCQPNDQLPQRELLSRSSTRASCRRHKVRWRRDQRWAGAECRAHEPWYQSRHRRSSRRRHCTWGDRRGHDGIARHRHASNRQIGTRARPGSSIVLGNSPYQVHLVHGMGPRCPRRSWRQPTLQACQPYTVHRQSCQT